MKATVAIAYLARATEDEELIKKRLEENFGIEFKITTVKGHWGNPIFIISSFASGKKAREILQRLKKDLGAEEILKAFAEEERKIFIKVDKFELFEGHFARGRGGKVEIKLQEYGKITPSMVRRWVDEL